MWWVEGILANGTEVREPVHGVHTRLETDDWVEDFAWGSPECDFPGIELFNLDLVCDFLKLPGLEDGFGCSKG